MKKRLFLPFAFVILTATAHANEKAVDELFDVMDMDQQLSGGVEATMPMLDQMAMQLRLNAEEKEELKSIFRAWFEEDIDRSKVIGEVKALYVETFTKDEIEKITAFLKTPVGQKFINKSPELMQRGSQIGIAEAQAKQHKLMERMKPFLEKHNINRRSGDDRIDSTDAKI